MRLVTRDWNYHIKKKKHVDKHVRLFFFFLHKESLEKLKDRLLPAAIHIFVQYLEKILIYEYYRSTTRSLFSSDASLAFEIRRVSRLGGDAVGLTTHEYGRL